MTSSAGWNSSRTRPGQQPACRDLGQREARRRRGRRCARRGRRRGRRPASCFATGRRSGRRPGGRRGRRAARPGGPSVPISASTPPPSGRVTTQPAPSSADDDRLGRAVLGPAQLGVGVQVAAERDEVVGVLVDDLVDDGRGGRGGCRHDLPSLVRLGRRRRRAAGLRPAEPAARPTARPVVRRRAPQRRPGEDRSRWASSSRTSAQVNSSCCSARLWASPSRAEVLAVRLDALPDVVDARRRSSPEQVTTGGRPLGVAAHQPQRSGELAGGDAGLALVVLAALRVGLVDRDHVDDLQDALLDALELVAGAGEGEEAGTCRPSRPRSPRTARRRPSRPARRRSRRPRARASPAWWPARPRRACRPTGRAG